MTKRQEERLARLMPNGIPKYVRCYNNGGKTIDRYTVVYTGNYNNIGHNPREAKPKSHEYVSMSGAPYHPQGVCQHGESDRLIDWPTYGHLGKKIKFNDLPEDCQKVVISDYKNIWALPDVD